MGLLMSVLTPYICGAEKNGGSGSRERDLGDCLHVYQNIVNKFKNGYDNLSVKIGKMILGTPEFSHRY